MTRRREGARTNSVKTIKTFRELTRSFGSPGAEMDMSIFGTTGSAPNSNGAKRSSNKAALKIAILHFG
jgi:hypothetical protein